MNTTTQGKNGAGSMNLQNFMGGPQNRSRIGNALMAMGTGFQGGDAGAVVKRYRDGVEREQRKQAIDGLANRTWGTSDLLVGTLMTYAEACLESQGGKLHQGNEAALVYRIVSDLHQIEPNATISEVMQAVTSLKDREAGRVSVC